VQDIPALTVRNVLKILWLADVCKYVDRGDSVSGATYVRGTYGPVPAELETLLQEEEQNHIISPERRIIFSFASNDGLVSVTDTQYIDYWIQRIAYLPTCRDRISESLDFAWKIALIGEQIPLYAVLANRICTSEIEDVRATAFTPYRHRHTLWTLAEHPTVRSVIATASQHSLRSADMWAAAKWALAHDPFRGRRVTTEAEEWSLTLHGNEADMLPTVRVLYVIEDRIVVIEKVDFEGP
jgi:Protein of unknown function (DUF4065)